MTSRIWVLGGYQSDFARNVSREGLDVADLTGEVVDHTLDSSGIGGADIGVVHVGNAFGQLFTGQGHLGAMPATVREDLWEVPSTRHEAPAPRAGSPSSPRWPTCAPAGTTARSWSGSSWRRRCPATRPPGTSARPRG